MSKTSSPRAWCAKCKGYQDMQQTKRLRALPPVLAINCGNLKDELSSQTSEKERAAPYLPKTYMRCF